MTFPIGTGCRSNRPLTPSAIYTICVYEEIAKLASLQEMGYAHERTLSKIVTVMAKRGARSVWPGPANRIAQRLAAPEPVPLRV